MASYLLRAAGLALWAFAVGCGSGGGEPGSDAAATAVDAEQAAAGQKTYLRLCAICHGQDARGVPKLGKDLRDNAFVRGLDDRELVEFLREGRPAWDPLNERGVDMPPMGGDPTLTEEQLAEIAAYLRTL